jgi:hypothetical protein
MAGGEEGELGTDVLANCEIRCVKCQGVTIRPVE